MKKIGVTQRVERTESYGETRDSLDHKWNILLRSLDMICIPLSNNTNVNDDYFNDLNLNGVILSGGNDLSICGDGNGASKLRDEFEKKLLKWSFSKRVPTLGICRGMQMIHCYLGGLLVQKNGHIGTYHKINPVSENFLFSKRKIVNSYHNYLIDLNTLSDLLSPLYLTDEGELEAFAHKNFPCYGIMWHPERSEKFDLDDIKLLEHLFRN